MQIEMCPSSGPQSAVSTLLGAHNVHAQYALVAMSLAASSFGTTRPTTLASRRANPVSARINVARVCAKSRARARTTTMAAAVPIMVNDLTGKMGRAVADAVVARGADVCYLVPVAFSGEAKDPVSVGDVTVDIKSIRDGDPGAIIKSLKSEHPGLIVVDYTLPAAVNANAALYVANDQPFVMGTTGGDRGKLLKDVPTRSCRRSSRRRWASRWWRSRRR